MSVEKMGEIVRSRYQGQVSAGAYRRGLRLDRPRIGAILAGAVLLITAAGCGTDPQSQVATASGSSTAPASADVVTAYVEAVREYVACLREGGISVSDPDARGRYQIDATGQSLKSDPKVLAAQQKCRNLLPPVPAELEDRPVLSPEQIENARQYATCMRENGAPDFPDPGPDGHVAERADGQPTWDQGSAGAQRAGRVCGPIIGVPATPGPGRG